MVCAGGVSVCGSGSVCGVAEFAPPPALFCVGGNVLRNNSTKAWSCAVCPPLECICISTLDHFTGWSEVCVVCMYICVHSLGWRHVN